MQEEAESGVIQVTEVKETPTPQEESFLKLADTFKLSAKLTNTSLKISLEDYIDWILYEKEYTEEDIGKEIHKKAELADLFSSLSQTNDTDQNKMKEMEMVKQNKYKFGDVIHLEGVPCYKVEREGKLTVYFDHYDRKTKKEIIYESNLRLTKLKSFSQVQILLRKFEQEKNAQEKGVFLNLEELKKEKLLQLLQKQQSDLSIYKKYPEILAQHEAQQKQIEKLKDQLKSTKNKLQETILQQAKFQQNSYSKLTTTDIVFFTSLAQANSQSFRFTSNLLEYIGNDKTYTQYLILDRIPANKIYTGCESRYQNNFES